MTAPQPRSSALLELAAKVEAAEGPDRELGREVLRACGWTQSTHGYFLGPLSGWTSPDRAIYFDDDDFVRGKHDPTAHIDAAMTLVPEGWAWLLNNYDGDEERPCSASLAKRPSWEWLHSLGAATPALALCAAALRALASQEQSHGQ